MKRKIEYFGLTLFIALFSLLSCTNEELPRNIETKGIEYRGEEFPLNLEANFEESSLRSVDVYEVINKVTLGREPHLILPDNVPVRVFVRKKGDEAATLSTVTLNGKVSKEEGRYKIQMNGTIKLRETNHSLKEGDWQILAVVGGASINVVPSDDQDAQPNDVSEMRHWVFPTSEWNPTVNAGSDWVTKAYDDETDDALSTMMPWMTDWQTLETASFKHVEEADGYGQNYKLYFKPRGILLRAKSRNNMVFNLRIKRLEITNTSNNLYFGGYFDMSAKGDSPVFNPANNITHSVGLNITNQPLVASGQEMVDCVYVWAMPSKENLKNVTFDVTMKAFIEQNNPKDILENNRRREIYLGDYGLITNDQEDKEDYSKNEKAATTVAFKTSLKISSVSSKNTYTIYPILTGQLFITESVVRPNVSKSNDYLSPLMPENGYKSAWGALELYNPTLTPINLADYGILRTTSPDIGYQLQRVVTHPMDLNKTVPAPTFVAKPPRLVLPKEATQDEKDYLEKYKNYFLNEYRVLTQKDLNRGLVQRLNFVDGETSTNTQGHAMEGYTTSVRAMYDTDISNTMLMPGKTVVILDASYVRYPNTTPDNINVDEVGSIGVQLKHAVRLKYAQIVVALDNAKVKTQQQDYRDSNGPVMYGSTFDSYFLMKRNANGTWTKIDEFGAAPQANWDPDNGIPWSSNYGTLIRTRHGRDGNARTRLSVILDPKGGYPGKDWWTAWAFTPSIEVGNDYVNRFCTLGSRFWLGPTEKSKEGEWDSVQEWTEPGQRNWTR